MVLTAPELTVKLVALKLAMPLAAVVALSMVMVAPEPLALARVSAPVRLLRLRTAVPPEQEPHCTSVAPDTRQRPALAGVATPSVLVPWPYRMLAAGALVRPVPPWSTASGEPSVRLSMVVEPVRVVGPEAVRPPAKVLAAVKVLASLRRAALVDN